MSSENAVQNVDASKPATDQGYEGYTKRLTDEKPGLVKRHEHGDADQGYEGLPKHGDADQGYEGDAERLIDE